MYWAIREKWVAWKQSKTWGQWPIWAGNSMRTPLYLIMLWCIVLYCLYSWVVRSESAHVRELALLQTRTLFAQLVSTRAWNAMYGGVFVLESERDKANASLPEDMRSLETAEGLRLIRVNPAYMTRQIAEIVNSRQGVLFHITSLDPVRAENAPDDWETKALLTFREGETEAFALCTHADGQQYYRYMAPLRVDTTCWDCHYVEPRGMLREDRPQGPLSREELVQAPPIAEKGARTFRSKARLPLSINSTLSEKELAVLSADCPAVSPNGERADAENANGALIPKLRGGISVSLAAGPLLAVEAERVRLLKVTYGGIGLLGVLGIGGAGISMCRRQAVAEAANRMKSVFLANMSHDMRTPLTGMLGMVELMDSPQCTAQKRAAYLAMLRGSADNLLEIITDITDFARLEAGKMVLYPHVFSLHHEVERVVDLFRFACEQKGLELAYSLDSSMPDLVVGDAFRLRQALGNLLGNAVKFTKEGHIWLTVSLVTEAHDSLMVRFGVRDTGCGIAAEDHERIFESFMQSSATERHKGSGSGLGLAITRDIAQLFDGVVGVESTVGQGSFFWLTVLLMLPNDAEKKEFLKELIIKDEQIKDSPEHLRDVAYSVDTASFCIAQEDKKNPVILVADDNPVVRLFFQDTLTHAGYRVLVASNGSEALDLLYQEPTCDLALLDVRMPKCSGTGILRHIRSGHIEGVPMDMPVYMVTASALSDEQELQGADDANGVVLKPLQAAALLELVHSIFPYMERSEGTPQDKNGVADEEAVQIFCHDSKTPLPCCNKVVALEGLDGNEALFTLLMKAFSEEAQERRDRLIHAIGQKDMHQLREEAHALCNSAGVLACEELLEKAKAMELCAIAFLENPHADYTVPLACARAMLAALDAVLAYIHTVLATPQDLDC